MFGQIKHAKWRLLCLIVSDCPTVYSRNKEKHQCGLFTEGGNQLS